MADATTKRLTKLIEPLRVPPGTKVSLPTTSIPATAAGSSTRRTGCELLAEAVELLAEYQARLAAQGTHGLLVVLQSLDAGGKDGTIRHVMSGVNPQGVRRSRASRFPRMRSSTTTTSGAMPAGCRPAGEIGIFNRSHYEEVLVVRVHPELLDREKLPPAAKGEPRLETALPRDQRLGALPRRQRHPRRQAVPQPVPGGAAETIPAPDRPCRRRTGSSRPATCASAASGTTTSGRSRRCSSHTSTECGAVVRHPRRSQVVRAHRGGCCARQDAARHQPALPDRGAEGARGAARGTRGAGGRGAEERLSAVRHTCRGAHVCCASAQRLR